MVNVVKRTLYDIRDSKPYTIRKLADGNCWMTTNLNYALSTGGTYIGSKNDGSTFEWTPTSCSTNGACALNNNTVAGSGMWYYNWYAATAGEGKASDINIDVDGSICPAGWRIPPNYSVQTNLSFGELTNVYGATTGGGATSGRAGVLLTYPLNFTKSRCRYNGGDPDSGTHGYYQSSTATSQTARSYYLYISQNNNTYPQETNYKSYGFNIRCVAL